MLTIGIVLSILGIGFLCWLIFTIDLASLTRWLVLAT